MLCIKGYATVDSILMFNLISATFHYVAMAECGVNGARKRYREDANGTLTNKHEAAGVPITRHDISPLQEV
jgi:hypothetical protein